MQFRMLLKARRPISLAQGRKVWQVQRAAGIDNELMVMTTTTTTTMTTMMMMMVVIMKMVMMVMVMLKHVKAC
jgi:hypothetical protein